MYVRDQNYCDGKYCDGMRDVKYLNESNIVRKTMIVCSCSGLPEKREGPRPGEREISDAEALLYSKASAPALVAEEVRFQAAA